MKLKSWLKELPYTLLQGSLETEVDEVVYDSRKAAPGTVFVCMRGANVDSHTFIPDVVEKGAPVLVVEHPVEAPENVTVIQVENGRNALSLLSAARFDYPARKMTAIGVTGTKGKTTTTYMIKAILEAAGQKTGLIGTNGAVIGENHYPTKNTTPESYILQEYFAKMVEAGCRYIVMEVSSQSYLMHRVDGLFFDYGIFLNISNDHIGPNEHASFEEYLYYKKQLLKNCRTALVNRDDPHFDAIVEGATAEILTFSLEQAADFTADDIHYVREHDFVGVEFQTHGRYEHDLRVGIPGKFNVDNALAAAGVCSFFDLPKEKVCHALEHIQVDGRMEIVYKSAKCTVIVDYAHNAVSMESLLLTLRDYKPKRLVCVFGCGGNRRAIAGTRWERFAESWQICRSSRRIIPALRKWKIFWQISRSDLQKPTANTLKSRIAAKRLSTACPMRKMAISSRSSEKGMRIIRRSRACAIISLTGK